MKLWSEYSGSIISLIHTHTHIYIYIYEGDDKAHNIQFQSDKAQRITIDKSQERETV